ncbi:MAG: hypothetical protein MZW92_21365 [Comamonadaceae bacterium]|nr:hypothetical protein [Comamonadaceae bacterium]
MVMRRDAALELMREDLRVAEDYEFWVRLAREHRFACLHAPQIRYALGSDNISFENADTAANHAPQLMKAYEVILSYPGLTSAQLRVHDKLAQELYDWGYRLRQQGHARAAAARHMESMRHGLVGANVLAMLKLPIAADAALTTGRRGTLGGHEDRPALLRPRPHRPRPRGLRPRAVRPAAPTSWTSRCSRAPAPTCRASARCPACCARPPELGRHQALRLAALGRRRARAGALPRRARDLRLGRHRARCWPAATTSCTASSRRSATSSSTTGTCSGARRRWCSPTAAPFPQRCCRAATSCRNTPGCNPRAERARQGLHDPARRRRAALSARHRDATSASATASAPTSSC